MKKSFFILLILVGLFLYSCKKENSKPDDCSPNSITYRQIINKQATIRQLPSGLFYIVEQATIDTKLIPCNLPIDFQIDNIKGWHKLVAADKYKDIIINSLHFLVEDKRIKLYTFVFTADHIHLIPIGQTI